MFKSLFKKDPANKLPRDPVCGMRVNESIAVVYKGQSYAFCSDHCKQQFEKNPEVYIKK